mmetsp:Transcript_27770/g.45144  ORF Transcript_27770/g.45144 Transcript_27770/m.45144 type:complete len:363 (-) Transcript_27770:369-1457(-)
MSSDSRPLGDLRRQLDRKRSLSAANPSPSHSPVRFSVTMPSSARSIRPRLSLPSCALHGSPAPAARGLLPLPLTGLLPLPITPAALPRPTPSSPPSSSSSPSCSVLLTLLALRRWRALGLLCRGTVALLSIVRRVRWSWPSLLLLLLLRATGWSTWSGLSIRRGSWSWPLASSGLRGGSTLGLSRQSRPLLISAHRLSPLLLWLLLLLLLLVRPRTSSSIDRLPGLLLLRLLWGCPLSLLLRCSIAPTHWPPLVLLLLLLWWLLLLLLYSSRANRGREELLLLLWRGWARCTTRCHAIGVVTGACWGSVLVEGLGHHWRGGAIWGTEGRILWSHLLHLGHGVIQYRRIIRRRWRCRRRFGDV